MPVKILREDISPSVPNIRNLFSIATQKWGKPALFA
jgi:hypothetical protein